MEARKIQSSSAADSVQRALDAGEEAFSALGFDGAGMKAIARAANVSQSLLHYHFGTKEALYRAVIERRANAINSERRTLLEKIDLTAGDAVRQVFEALLGPPLGPIGGGLSYARIFSGMIAGGTREVELVRELYDPTASRFIDALVEASPGTSRRDATLAYSMALGVLATALPGDGRIARLAGTEPLKTREELLPSLVTYVCGGFEALKGKPAQT